MRWSSTAASSGHKYVVRGSRVPDTGVLLTKTSVWQSFYSRLLYTIVFNSKQVRHCCGIVGDCCSVFISIIVITYLMSHIYMLFLLCCPCPSLSGSLIASLKYCTISLTVLSGAMEKKGFDWIGRNMTPFIIPQVVLIKSLIREIYSRGTSESVFFIIVDERSVFFLCVKRKGRPSLTLVN